MIRILFLCLLFGAIVGSALHAPWLGLPVAGVVLVIRLTMQAQGKVAPTTCPFCRKRVKLDAKACHHCGRQLVAG